MNDGKKFEQDFIASCDFFTYRLKDGGGWSNAENTRFTSSNICDFIGFKGGKLMLMELKSCAGTSIPYDNMKQLDSMNKVCYDGVHPIFILNFRKYDRTYVLKASKLVELRETLGKKSISYMDCELHGKLLPQEKKRTRFKYFCDILP